eukprot:2059650-Amphidinium_carterae.1
MALASAAAARFADQDEDEDERDGAGQDPGQAARLPPLINNKVIPRPPRLTDKTHWYNWRFEFENYLVCLQDEYLEEMRLALQVGGPVTLPSGHPELRRRAFALYAILASLCTGK